MFAYSSGSPLKRVSSRVTLFYALFHIICHRGCATLACFVPKPHQPNHFFPRWKNVLRESKDPRFSNFPRRNLLSPPILQTAFLGLASSPNGPLSSARISSSSRHSPASLNGCFFNATLFIRFATMPLNPLHGFLLVNDSFLEETRKENRVRGKNSSRNERVNALQLTRDVDSSVTEIN